MSVKTISEAALSLVKQTTSDDLLDRVAVAGQLESSFGAVALG